MIGTKIKILFITILVLVLEVPISVFAQDNAVKKGDVLTIEKCIDIAISKNPNINLAENTTKIYKSRIGQVKSNYFPQMTVGSGYSRQNSITSFGADNDDNQYSGNVALNQLIYDFGKTPSKVKIQNYNLSSSNLDVDNTVIQIAYNVKQAYYSALSAKISKDIYAQAIYQYEQHLKQAKAFYSVGTKSKIDVTTADVNLSNARLNYIKANDSYKTAISNLNNVMGIPDAPEYSISDTVTFKNPWNKPEYMVNISNQTPIKKNDKNLSNKNIKNSNSVLKSNVTKYDVVENLTFKKFEITLEDALKKAYANRPDLKSLVLKESAAAESIKLARKDYYPAVSGFANYGFGGRDFPLDNGWSFGANVNIPVFNGFLTKSQVDEAKANLEIAKSNIEIQKQNIYLQVEQSYINLTESEKRIPVAQVIVKQAKENLELANGRYTVGIGNSIEVQDAEINYNNAQLAYVQAFYDYNTARSTLEKAMGIK